MKLRVYEEIVAIIKSWNHRKECLQALIERFPLEPRGTLLSIYSQHYQLFTKAVHSKHRKSSSMQEYYQQYLSKMSQCADCSETLLLEMANEVSFSPTLYARLILEQYIHTNDLLPSKTAVSSLVSQWIKTPSSIPDSLLQQQVRYCVLKDSNYGPLAENLKHSVGYQYEFLLLEKVQEIGIPFLVNMGSKYIMLLELIQSSRYEQADSNRSSKAREACRH